MSTVHPHQRPDNRDFPESDHLRQWWYSHRQPKAFKRNYPGVVFDDSQMISASRDAFAHLRLLLKEWIDYATYLERSNEQLKLIGSRQDELLQRIFDTLLLDPEANRNMQEAKYEEVFGIIPGQSFTAEDVEHCVGAIEDLMVPGGDAKRHIEDTQALLQAIDYFMVMMDSDADVEYDGMKATYDRAGFNPRWLIATGKGKELPSLVFNHVKKRSIRLLRAYERCILSLNHLLLYDPYPGLDDD